MAKTKGAKARPTKDPKGRCGTTAGYSAHGRRGERPCGACRDAKAAKAREAYARSKAAGPATTPGPAPVQATAPGLSSVQATAPVRPVSQEDLDPRPDLPEPPAYLRAKGRALWDSVVSAYTLTPAALAMLGEACRTADRLERMAAALSSRSTLWFEVEPSLADQDVDTSVEFSVVVNGMIGEARQLQTTLRQTLTTLGVVGVEAANTGQESTSVLDQLAQRRQARLAGGGA